MIPKYATQFRLVDRETQVRPTSAAVEQVVAEWIQSLEKTAADTSTPSFQFQSGSTFEHATEVVGNEEQWAARYSRPDPRSEVQWVTDIGVAVSDTETRVSLSVSVSLPRQRRVRVQHRVRPPRLARRSPIIWAMKAWTFRRSPSGS